MFCSSIIDSRRLDGWLASDGLAIGVQCVIKGAPALLLDAVEVRIRTNVGAGHTTHFTAQQRLEAEETHPASPSEIPFNEQRLGPYAVLLNREQAAPWTAAPVC